MTANLLAACPYQGSSRYTISQLRSLGKCMQQRGIATNTGLRQCSLRQNTTMKALWDYQCIALKVIPGF